MSEQLERGSFPLEVDEEGWPPFGAETMWAKRTDQGHYQIDNSPWFAEKVALGDIVSVVWPKEDEIAQYDSTIAYSGNVSLSVIILDEAIEEETDGFLEQSEVWFEQGRPGSLLMYAVSVESLDKYAPIKEVLLEYEARDVLSFAELSLPEATNDHDDRNGSRSEKPPRA